MGSRLQRHRYLALPVPTRARPPCRAPPPTRIPTRIPTLAPEEEEEKEEKEEKEEEEEKEPATGVRALLMTMMTITVMVVIIVIRVLQVVLAAVGALLQTVVLVMALRSESRTPTHLFFLFRTGVAMTRVTRVTRAMMPRRTWRMIGRRVRRATTDSNVRRTVGTVVLTWATSLPSREQKGWKQHGMEGMNTPMALPRTMDDMWPSPGDTRGDTREDTPTDTPTAAARP